MKTLWLKKGEDRRIRAGHLWIFSNEIDSAKSPLPDFEPGENATLRDARGAVLGSVFVNPHSLICARLYSRKADLPLDADLLRQRLQSALGLRQRLYNQPWYRLCHGEGDLLPGLVMDRFGDHLTVQVGTWGMEARKEELREVLGELLQPRSILWDNDIAARSLEGLPRENESEGPVPDVLEVPENGCIFRAPLQGGQKTGWFYDQRRNRREADRDPAGHAEFLAMKEAARVLDAWRLTDCTVYVTLEPCIMCAGLMHQARVARCVYGAPDQKAGAVGTLYDIHADTRLNHQFEATGGVCEEECVALLRDFFRARRKKEKERE